MIALGGPEVEYGEAMAAIRRFAIGCRAHRGKRAGSPREGAAPPTSRRFSSTASPAGKRDDASSRALAPVARASHRLRPRGSAPATRRIIVNGENDACCTRRRERARVG
jgi:hypothetical protein